MIASRSSSGRARPEPSELLSLEERHVYLSVLRWSLGSIVLGLMALAPGVAVVPVGRIVAATIAYLAVSVGPFALRRNRPARSSLDASRLAARWDLPGRGGRVHRRGREPPPVPRIRPRGRGHVALLVPDRAQDRAVAYDAVPSGGGIDRRRDHRGISDAPRRCGQWCRGGARGNGVVAPHTRHRHRRRRERAAAQTAEGRSGIPLDDGGSDRCRPRGRRDPRHPAGRTPRHVRIRTRSRARLAGGRPSCAGRDRPRAARRPPCGTRPPHRRRLDRSGRSLGARDRPRDGSATGRPPSGGSEPPGGAAVPRRRSSRWAPWPWSVEGRPRGCVDGWCRWSSSSSLMRPSRCTTRG